MKYEITKKKKHRVTVNGSIVLQRVRALKDFSNVKKGDLGGFVEKEDNLSQVGNSWIYDNAAAFGRARVSENARVCNTANVSNRAIVSGNAKISENAWVCRKAKVYDNARVGGCAKVLEDATKTVIHIGYLNYPVTITDNHIKIGCEIHTYEEWENFSERDIFFMDGDLSLKFWKENKITIMELTE
jgi:acetyltransferase-like isoleucine patch superfamily enzyme